MEKTKERITRMLTTEQKTELLIWLAKEIKKDYEELLK